MKPGDLASIARLQRDYEQRYEAWSAQLTELGDPRLQAALVSSHDAAGAYFEALDGPFLSAARDGDRAGMQEIVTGALAQQYALQQATAQRVGVVAQERLDSVERAAAAQLVSDRRLMIAAGLALGLLAVCLTLVTLRSTSSRLRRMRHLADKEFPRLVSRAEFAADGGSQAENHAVPAVRGNDELARTERAFHRVVGSAVDLAGETARLRHTTADLFAYVGRRNHQLLSQSLTRLSAIEDVDPGSAREAHLAELRIALTRMRRNADGMLVVAGVASRRQWDEPVSPSHAMQAALSEIEGAARVDWDLDDSVALVGPVGADLTQVLVELLDNASRFSPPETPVSVRGLRDGDDYLIVISDEGLGMPAADVALANELLASSEVDLHDSRRIGLSIVARLADRRDFAVTLATGPTGGLVARVQLPAASLEQVAAHPVPALPPETLPSETLLPESLSPAALSLAEPPPAAAVAVLPVPLDVESIALPRRIRGASLDPQLFEVPAYAAAPEPRSPQAARDALTALAAGRAAAADRHPDQGA